MGNPTFSAKSAFRVEWPGSHSSNQLELLSRSLIMNNQPAGQLQKHARSLLRKAAPFLLVLALVEGITVATIYYTERSELKRDMFKSFQVGGKVSDRYEMAVPGIKQPPVHRAEEVRLNDAEEVIGVEIRGQARAYRLAAMKGREQHIVNDLVAGVPVSVTYCDVTECVRAFIDRNGHAPLDISQGGLKAEHMVITILGTSYIQDSAEPLDSSASNRPIPYDALPVERTSWKAWKTAHPDTEVYDGEDSSTPG